jgi:hypothetical protein
MPKPNPVARKAKVNNPATDTAVNVDNPKKPSNIDETPAPTPTCPALHLTHFSIGRPLGKGKYGQVYLAKHHATNYICALKMINKASIRRCEEERLVRREIEVHQNLAHPNILRLLGWFHDDERIYLVLEYAPGGSLFQALRGQPGGRFREEVAARYLAQMALALRYMHGKNIMHRYVSFIPYLPPYYETIILIPQQRHQTRKHPPRSTQRNQARRLRIQRTRALWSPFHRLRHAGLHIARSRRHDGVSGEASGILHESD